MLVAEADGRISLSNPETRRLLGDTGRAHSCAAWIRDLLDRAPGDRRELEHSCGNPEAE